MGYGIYLLGKLTEDKIPKFTAINYVEIFDQSNGNDNKNKDIKFETNQLRNDLCDFNDAYIVVAGKITATDPDPDDDAILYERKLALKNTPAPFLIVS